MKLARLFAFAAIGPICSVYGALSYNSSLATADAFAILAATTVTNTGPTVIDGSLGVWAGTAVTGFPPGTVTNGTIHEGDAVAMSAQTDAASLFAVNALQGCSMDLSGEDLGSRTLTPGVYCYSSSALLTGNLLLDALGDPNAIFLFQIGSTLTTASDSSVTFAGSGQGGSVFWNVGSSATLGTGTSFNGNILAVASVTLTTDASIGCGRAIALGGAVTLDTNNVSINSNDCLSTLTNVGVPEPSSAALLLLVSVPGLIWLRRTRSKRKTCRKAHN